LGWVGLGWVGFTQKQIKNKTSEIIATKTKTKHQIIICIRNNNNNNKGSQRKKIENLKHIQYYTQSIIQNENENEDEDENEKRIS
jgi:hypothetical protein